MVTESRVESAALMPDPLRDELHQRPGRFEFFQAVRLLAALDPDRAQVGEFQDPDDEVVRFSVPPRIGRSWETLPSMITDDHWPVRASVWNSTGTRSTIRPG